MGAAIALKSGVKTAAEAAKMIGVGLQSFCIDGSVADDRKVGLGHGNLGAMLLSDESKCFAFLAGHESFAAAEGAIGIVKNANKARKQPLRVILNGLGKDAAQIISRINGFTYVQTQFDYYTGKLNIVREIRYSEGERADVRCYGADDVREGVAIMHHEGVDVSITGNSTNPTRFQHPVAGTYKKECIEQGKKYFSVASGGGTGRTLHPDNMAAGPASYGMTDTMGRMHSDAQFAGSSSVPAHVEMMGFLTKADTWSFHVSALFLWGSMPRKLLFQLQAVLEGLAHTLRNPVIAVGIGVEGDGVHPGDIHLAVRHDPLIGGDVHHPADDAAAILAALILDELALQAEGELVDNGGVHGFGPAGGQAAAGQLVGNPVPGLHAEIVGLHHVGRVGDADGEGPTGLDVLNGFVALAQVQRHDIPLHHGAPGGVHHVHTAVLVIRCDHQNRHGEDPFGELQLCSHGNISLQTD